MKKSISKELCLIALFVALLCVSAWISIPIGAVPVTLQTLAVLLAAGYLGAKRGAAAVTVYLLLGALGVPVFSSFSGGLASFFSPTCGFLVGLVPAAFLMGALSGKHTFSSFIVGGGVAVLITYAFGVAGFLLYAGGAAGLMAVMTTCVLPFLPFDVIKVLAAALVLRRLRGRA